MFTIIDEIEITKKRFDNAAKWLQLEAKYSGEVERILMWFENMRNDYYTLRALECTNMVKQRARPINEVMGMSNQVLDTDSLTAAQAAAIVGQDKVDAVEYVNCELTNTLRDDNLLEWSASVKAIDTNGIDCRLYAMYYTTQQQVYDAGDDLSNIDWQIDHYRVR